MERFTGPSPNEASLFYHQGVRPKKPLIGHEISKHYDNCHKMFNKQGFFHPEVAVEYGMKIAADILGDPKFPVDRVNLQVVKSLPFSVTPQDHKDLIHLGSFTVKQALHESRDPQKLRHLIVSVFHYQHSLYETMERIHSHYTKQHVQHSPQTTPVPRSSEVEIPVQLTQEGQDPGDTISRAIELTEIVHTTQVQEQESIQSCPEVLKDIKHFEIKRLQVDRNQLLGRGYYGHVYCAKWLGTLYAVKEIALHPRKKKNHIDPFIVNEIRAGAAIKHPSVVKFIGYSLNIDPFRPSIFIVNELIHGHDLETLLYDDELIQKYHFNSDKVKYKVMVDIASALGFLHFESPKIIIHGDVKPSNIMLSDDGQAKLCDLGLCKIKQSNFHTISGSGEGGFGTPAYMAPEILLDKKTSSTRSDVYSYGATLHKVMFRESLWDIENMGSSGHIKFYYGPSRNPLELLKEKVSTEKVPKTLKDKKHPAIEVITKCVQFDRRDRPSSMEVLIIMKKLYETAPNQTTAQGYPADHEKETQSSSALTQPQSLVKKMLPIDMAEIYTKQDREKLVGYHIFILVPLGETMAGKTTLLRTIKAMASCLTREDERTNLAEVSSWSPEEQPEVLFMLYDVGGHESYKNTTHIFQVDSSLMISLICHDITTDECNTTMFWIKTCQMNAPNSKMQILLTKVDKITPQEREDRKASFVKEFTDLLNKEIQMTESNKEKTKSVSKKEVFERHLFNYRDLKKQIQQTLFLEVSCVPGWEDSVKGVTRCLLEFADKQKHLVMLSPIEKELFVRIGKLGIKQRMIEPQMAGADTSKNTENKGMQVDPKKPGTDETNNSGNKNMQEGLQMTGTDKSVKSKKAPVGDDRPHSTDFTHSTDTNIQPFSTKDQKVNTMQQQFLTFSEVLEVFTPIFKKYHPNCQKAQLQKGLKESLSNLKRRGLLRHFTGDKDLENIIFHDISTLVSILRSIFHHNIQTSLTYQIAYRHYSNRHDFNRDISSLTQHGILSMTLLEHLLQQSECLISATIVAKLLSSLDVGIIFTDDTSKKNKVFIPYFLENVQAPEDIEKKKEDITTCKENFLALQTVVDTNAPTTFFNQLMIKVYQTLQRVLPFRKAVHIWSQGLFVSLDEHRGKLMLYHNAQNEVEFFISADVTHIDGHHLLWEYVQLIDTSFLNIQECKFPGLPGVYILKCTECCLTGSTDVYEFFVHEMLNPDIQPKESFSCGDTSDLPRALISPMPKDEAKQKRCHESLLTYLKEHCPSKDKPRGGPRLGMTETSSAQTFSEPFYQHRGATGVTFILHPEQIIGTTTPLLSTISTRVTCPPHGTQTSVASIFCPTQTVGTALPPHTTHSAQTRVTSPLHPIHSTSIPAPLYSTQATTRPPQTTVTSLIDSTESPDLTSIIHPLQMMSVTSPLDFSQTARGTSLFDPIHTTCVTSPIYPTDPNLPSTLNSTQAKIITPVFDSTQTTGQTSLMHPPEIRNTTSTINSEEISVKSLFIPTQTTDLPSPVCHTEMRSETSTLDSIQTGVASPLYPRQITCLSTPLLSTQTTGSTSLHPTQTCVTSLFHPIHSTGIPPPLNPTQAPIVTTPLHSTQTTSVTYPLHPTLTTCETSTLQPTLTSMARPFYFPQTTGVTYPPDSIQTTDVTSPIHPAQPDVQFPQTPDGISIPQTEDITEARPPANAEQSEYFAETSAQPNQQTIGVTYPPDSIQTPDVTSPINHAQPEVQFPQTPDDISIPQTNDNTEARPLANAEQSEYLAGTSAQPSQQVVQLFSDLRSGLRSDMATYMLRLSNQVFAQGQVMAHHVHQTVALQSGDASSLPLNLQHPALRALKDELVQGMNVNAELLMCCISSGLLTEIDKISILNDNNPLGRAKRLLLKVDSQGYGGPDNLVTALRQCGGSNKRLADTLNDTLRGCYMPDP